MARIDRRIFMAACAALAMGLAGGARAQDTTGLTKDTIKIGVFGPMTGSAALFGKAVFGVEAVFKEVNDKGGIHGRKIQLVREDTACDPARGLAAYKKLVAQEKVFAVNGGLCSNVMMAVKGEIEKSKVPFVVIGAASPAISRPLVPNLFQPVATTDDIGRTLIDYAMSRPNTSKIAFVSHSDDWGKSNRDPAVAYLKEKYKLDPVADLTMERASSDATPQILRLRNSGAEFVVLMMYPAEVAVFMRDAYKYGLKVPVLGPQSISLEDTRDRVGGVAAVRNMAVYYPYARPLHSPEMRQWTQLINKYYPNERVESFSFLGMSGAYALVKALQDAGPDLTREKLITALDGIRNFDSGISSAPINFSPQEHAGIRGGAMAKFKDDQIVVVKQWEQ
ncbi:ABC transporter substrate-binding protein [Bordetella genomosp. 13]|uniref:ABC transporter substrate-binding protein n=1 Tax=Bordetella genomosp. 13 TaxID=463040 RepID=UPI0016433697|nr:ABC transporter substrate-binding protein [Bordetella genomosp. 13]